LLDVEPGDERAVAAALGRRASAIVADDATAALALAERARAAGLGTVVILTRHPAELVRELPVVPEEGLLETQGPAVTREGLGHADAGSTRTGALAEELRRLGAEEVGARRAAQEAGERLSAVDVERARIDAEADEARRRLEAAGADPAEGEDRDELAERIERLERRRESLGQVNPLAKEEYDSEQE